MHDTSKLPAAFAHVAAARSMLLWKADAELSYIGTFFPADADYMGAMMRSFKNMANTIRDVDTDVRIIVGLVDVDEHGAEADAHLVLSIYI